MALSDAMSLFAVITTREFDDHDQALERITALAGELERSHPGAAASLREGLEETLTVTRLGARGPLKRTLQSTNPCESMIECLRRSARNVKRWQSGEMCLRWTAAGMLEAERQFRRVIGYRELAKLAVAVEREVAREPALTASPSPVPEVVATPREIIHVRPPPKFHGDRDMLAFAAVVRGGMALAGVRQHEVHSPCRPLLTSRGGRDRQVRGLLTIADRSHRPAGIAHQRKPIA